MKFRIEYRRTVQIAPYESLSIGLLEEFEEDVSHLDAFESIRNQVDYWIEMESERLRAARVQ